MRGFKESKRSWRVRMDPRRFFDNEPFNNALRPAAFYGRAAYQDMLDIQNRRYTPEADRYLAGPLRPKPDALAPAIAQGRRWTMPLSHSMTLQL
ncbi:hypothetical protein [Rhizobium sp. BK377]|uniref:hypothetical protein n=1 Tax=Rhizobium sp. BK377 TaxID=2587058 RepID=UPI001620CE31|nr:hypothetical protein [Rhizobium sp. BK377]MBB3461563.1 hypothetical protein [Rhizobium sp. BK377]